MEKKKLKAGIVGSGFSASFHLEALRKVCGVEVEVAGVYSPTARNREKFARERELPVFDSLEELIDEADVLHACVPPAAHEPVALEALGQGKSVIIEKPFTGYFGDGSREFSGDTFSREKGQAEALESIRRMREAEDTSAGFILYAENWVYAPAIQKEREIIEKTGAQVLWLHGEESHSGSHSQYYGIWSFSGGGSMIGKGVHPLTAALYLKKVEGRMRSGEPIRPRSVSARTHALTRSPNFENKRHLKTGYTDIEDFAAIHVVFDDGTFADIFASELVLGGVHNWLEIAANNHRGRVNINPNDAFMTYSPRGRDFEDIYVVEKTETKEGWAFTSPDEDWFTGYQHEMEAFYRTVAYGEPLESDSMLAADTISTVYSGYLSAAWDGREIEVPQL
jgi:predicted dehydrogenase